MTTCVAMTSDYAADRGDPSPFLRRIADAGFSHVHWCHQWNTDFLYGESEIDQIARWLKAFGLHLLDLHGSDGVEKRWNAPQEYARLAGVELVANRMAMTARLGGDAVVMHPGKPEPGREQPFWDALRRSLDALQPLARQHGIRLAVENGDWAVLRALFADYPPDFIGLCYDCGHGNLVPDGLDQFAACLDRLTVTHLHDNDGQFDRHDMLFSGTVPWQRLATLLARSPYRKPLTLEVNMRNAAIKDEAAFLARSMADARRLATCVDSARSLA